MKGDARSLDYNSDGVKDAVWDPFETGHVVSAVCRWTHF